MTNSGQLAGTIGAGLNILAAGVVVKAATDLTKQTQKSSKGFNFDKQIKKGLYK
jgi:hypothetical protein